MQENTISKRQEGGAIDALYRISTLSGKRLNSVRALEKILDEVMQVFSANSVSISLLNASSDTLFIEVQRGLPEKTRGFELPVGVGITGWVAAHGEPLLCQDVEQEEKYFQLDETGESRNGGSIDRGWTNRGCT